MTSSIFNLLITIYYYHLSHSPDRVYWKLVESMASTQLVLTSLLVSIIARIGAQIIMDAPVDPDITIQLLNDTRNATGTLDNIMGGGGGGTEVNRDRVIRVNPDRTAGVARDSVVAVDRDRGVGGARDTVVGVDRDRGIGGAGNIVMAGDRESGVGGARATVVGVDRDRGVGGARETAIRVDRDRGVGEASNIITARDIDAGVGGARATVVGVDMDRGVGGARETVIRADRDRGMGGARDTVVGVDRDRGMGGARETVVGVDRDRGVGGARETVVGVDRDRGVGGARETVVGVDRDRGVGGARETVIRADRDRGVDISRNTVIRTDRDRFRDDRGFGFRRNDTGAPDLILDAGAPILTTAQRELNERCFRKCKTELCYLADDDDCRNFITCQQDARGRYHATLQPCAFGTYWAGLQLQKKITCDVPDNVVCNIDYCAGRPMGSKYDHYDGNCKTYWECDGKGKPLPRCCPEGFRYEERRGECVEDRGNTCSHRCPIKVDACLLPGTRTEFFDDGNCRTYWDCEEQHPHPVCCPEGQGYDVIEGCIPQRLCNNTCPPQYEPDICLQPGIEKYSLIDGSCRTYMKCNPVEGDERWCCPSNYVFDSGSQSCIERTIDMDLMCDDSCPYFYHEVCHLQAVPDRPDHYYMTIHGTQMERPCAPGTHFDITKCGCAKIVKDSPDNSCSKELDIIFDHPMWHRSGSQSQVEIINVGTLEEGPKLNGRTSFQFNGDLYFRTPFFQSQYDNLYIKIVYLPETSATGGKQVLLSNCMNLDLGAPSMELSLQGDRLVLDLVTDSILPNATFTQNRPVTASVPYTPGIWNTFTAIYNGRNVYLLNEGQGAATFDRQSLTGPISVAAEGLDFGGCYINRGSGEGFFGSLAQLEFSKCLKQTWVDIFNSNLPMEP